MPSLYCISLLGTTRGCHLRLCRMFLDISSESWPNTSSAVLIEGETISISCKVEHDGSDWLPNIVFFNSEGGLEYSYDCIFAGDPAYVVRRCMEKQIELYHDGWAFECRTTFPVPPDALDDPNADQFPPDFINVFTFPVLIVHCKLFHLNRQEQTFLINQNVLDAPRNMKLFPVSNSTLEVGQQILCSAESNPEVSFFQYFDEEDEVIDFGSILTIPPECEGQRVCITCLALNEMRGGNLGQGTKTGCYNIAGRYITHFQLSILIGNCFQ